MNSFEQLEMVPISFNYFTYLKEIYFNKCMNLKKLGIILDGIKFFKFLLLK